MQRRIWEEVPVDAAAVDQIAGALRLPAVVARLLWQRNLGDPDVAHRFLHPELTQLHDPFLLAGMREAVDRLLAAIARAEPIAIHGDYDVDGVTSTVILRRAIELYQDREHALLAQRFAYDPKAAALAYLGISLLAQGRTEEAKQYFAQALAHAEAVGHLVSWANTLAHVGLGYMVAGDEAAVRRTADALGRVAAEQGFPYWMAHAAIQRGWLRLASDDELDGFSEGIASYRASGSRLAVPALLTMQAAAHLRHGEMENAKARLEEAKQLAAETNERWYEPETLRLLAETLAGIGCRTEVELEFRRPAQLAT